MFFSIISYEILSDFTSPVRYQAFVNLINDLFNDYFYVPNVLKFTINNHDLHDN